jgi:two-component system, NarL family, sensor kinase
LWHLHEAEETVNAIRYGRVDAFVVEEPEGHRVYTLETADLPYSVLVETMQQGAAMLDGDGQIIYCNASLAAMVDQTRESLIGVPLKVLTGDPLAFQELLQEAVLRYSAGELQLLRKDGTGIPANFELRLLSRDKSTIGVLVTDLTAQKQEADIVARLQQVQDGERRRLARELHDSVGQLLASIAMNIARVRAESDKLSPEVAELVIQNGAMVNEITNEIRTISHLLHPPLLDEMGLPLALRWYIDGFMERSKIRATVEVPDGFDRLPPDTEIAVFRAVQECLANVHRHSGSSSCSVKLVRNDHELQLQVQDSGSGIPKEKLPNVMSLGGVGLRGMRERIRRLGGTLAIDSNESGTTVSIRLPIHSGKSASANSAPPNEEVA